MGAARNVDCEPTASETRAEPAGNAIAEMLTRRATHLMMRSALIVACEPKTRGLVLLRTTEETCEAAKDPQLAAILASCGSPGREPARGGSVTGGEGTTVYVQHLDTAAVWERFRGAWLASIGPAAAIVDKNDLVDYVCT